MARPFMEKHRQFCINNMEKIPENVLMYVLNETDFFASKEAPEEEAPEEGEISEEEMTYAGRSQEKLFRPKKNWKKKAIDKPVVSKTLVREACYPIIDLDKARICFRKDFPPKGHYMNVEEEIEVERQMNKCKGDFKYGSKLSYRFNISELLNEKCVYEVENTDIRIVSAPDVLCFWSATASIAYQTDENGTRYMCEESYMQAKAMVDPTNPNGHNIHVVKMVCDRLNLNYMKLEDFKATL